MLKSWGLLKNLTETILKPTPVRDSVISENPVIDIWIYAEPAGDEPDPLNRNVLQWRRLISSVREPFEEFSGQAVNVIGFVHHASGDEPSHFTLARQIIRCCLADTVPLGLLVQWDGEPFEVGTWLHVQGQFTRSGEQGEKLAIAPAAIAVIQPPQKLYINGVF